MFKQTIIFAALIAAFAIVGFGQTREAIQKQTDSPCRMTANERADKHLYSLLDVKTKTKVMVQSLERALQGSLNADQRSVIFGAITLFPRLLAADTSVANFYETELGKETLAFLASAKLAFSVNEYVRIFERPDPVILKSFDLLFAATNISSTGEGNPLPDIGDCSCTAVISGCAWVHGCYTATCRVVVNCGPAGAFNCDIVCNAPPV